VRAPFEEGGNIVAGLHKTEQLILPSSTKISMIVAYQSMGRNCTMKFCWDPNVVHKQTKVSFLLMQHPAGQNQKQRNVAASNQSGPLANASPLVPSVR
jgi:hypothetical protein